MTREQLARETNHIASREHAALSAARLANHQREVERLLAGSGVPARYLSVTFDACPDIRIHNRAAFEVAREWAKGFEMRRKDGSNLILLGSNGTAKTWIAYAVLSCVASMSRQGNRFTVLAVRETSFLGSLRDSYSNPAARTSEIMRAAETPDLLLIDDIGKAPRGQDQNRQSLFFELLDSRYSNMLPTIITSNLDETALAQWIGEAASSRLRDQNAVLAKLGGPDLRKHGSIP